MLKKTMEQTNIKIGLSQHFPRVHWQNETKYLDLYVNVIEKDLQIHHITVSSAFQNILAFLKSINKTDKGQSKKIYDSILEADPCNLNALYGLHEIELIPRKKKEYEQKVKEILNSQDKNMAIAKAIMEIGIALCLLIPRYNFEKANLDYSDKPCIEFDGFDDLVFQTENLSMGVDLYTDTHIAQKKRVCSSVRYLNEAIKRMIDFEPQQNKQDIMVLKFFLSMAYNRLDNWVAFAYNSTELRKQFSLQALELFCEVAVSFDPSSGYKPDRMYFQRCLAYIGHILVSRKKDILMSFEGDEYIPKCFLKYQGHFIRQLWDEPEQSFLRALEYGYNPTVNTRYAKYLFHEQKYDASIEKINEVFENEDHNWYSASIRMVAYKKQHMEKWKDASKQGDFSSLTNELLLKAEVDGEYCFQTFATAKDQSAYAAILRWLGTFPDGKTVTDKSKIESALYVLNRIYEEQGCHTHNKVHKAMAECHYDMGDLDSAIKYALWSLNSTPCVFKTFPIPFSILINFLLEKFQQNRNAQDTLRTLSKMRYYIQSEISRRCHELIQIKLKDVLSANKNLANKLQMLLEKYDKKVIDEIKAILDQQLGDGLSTIIENFGVLLSIVQKWCRRFPDEMKSLLEFSIDTAGTGPLQTFVCMSLICLGKNHKEWTQRYNRKLKNKVPKAQPCELDLFTSNMEDFPEKDHFDFLIINAPEDKDWVFYTFLPEMEERPIEFAGCIPDRDFKKGESFEKNVMHCLAKTSKVLLALTDNFLKRTHELFGKDGCILKKLEEMHSSRAIDVITLFVEPVTLNLEKHAMLVKFDNVDSSAYGLEWNYLRKLLVRSIQSPETTRETVKWRAGANEKEKGVLIAPHRETDETFYKNIVEDILPYGLPEAMYILYHPAFVIGYDGEKRIPRWVAHRIDSKIERGVVSRKTHHKQLRNVHPDTTIPEQARSAENDYKSRKEFTLGHMTPLADHSSTLELAKDTNILTNMVPEVKHNCLWNRLEEYCRDSLTDDFETIYVMSGTLFLPMKDDDGRRFVNYEVIGRNNVAVPTDFFKIIVAKQSGETQEKIGAFVIPNESLYDAELADLTTSISWIEKHQGVDLFRDMDKDRKRAETTTLTTPFFTKNDRVFKMIRDVNSKDGLNKIWEKLTEAEKIELQGKYDDKLKRLEKIKENN